MECSINLSIVRKKIQIREKGQNSDTKVKFERQNSLCFFSGPNLLPYAGEPKVALTCKFMFHQTLSGEKIIKIYFI